MRYADLVETSEQVRGTRSRNRKLELLAACLRRLPPGELAIGAHHLAGQTPQDRLELGWAAIRDTEVAATDEPTLTVADVDAALEAIATVSGPGSRTTRLATFEELLARATAPEQAFLRALVLGELRQGALEGLVAQATARAAEVDEALVRRALMLRGDLGAVADAALRGGRDALAGIHLELFRPLQPMLAQTSADAPGALEGLGPAVVEAKLDGARIQVHRRGDQVRVYTRNLREVTDHLPELVAAVRGYDLDAVVLDGEAIARRADGRPHPFQVTMSRFGRSTGADQAADELPLSPVFFDCLHLDGEDLLDEPLRTRLRRLDAAVPGRDRVDRSPADSASAVDAFLARVLDAGHEGVVVKGLTAPYDAGRRGASWRKLKPVHTLDLVVLAAEWGSGRRQGWLSNLHLGARDPDGGGFVMLGKTFKGLTDELLAWQTDELLARETHRRNHVVHVRPELVVEVAFDGVQSSPRYPAGLALRFARVKGYRPDKSPQQADTVDTVRAIHDGRRRPS